MFNGRHLKKTSGCLQLSASINCCSVSRPIPLNGELVMCHSVVHCTECHTELIPVAFS